MTWRNSVATRNRGLDAKYDALNGGTIEYWSGSQPATGDATATGTLLCTFTLPSPAFSAAAGGVKDLDADPDLTTTAVATGSVGWARFKDSSGNLVTDGSVGTSGADLIISSTSITTGQTVNLTLGSITDPP